MLEEDVDRVKQLELELARLTFAEVIVPFAPEKWGSTLLHRSYVICYIVLVTGGVEVARRTQERGDGWH